MATISNVTTATSTTSTATLDLTSITAAVGDLLVLACAADNAGASGVSSTSTTITDAAGNTWTNRGQTTRTPTASANDGSTLALWTCAVTAALSSATITINFSPNTTAKAAVLLKVAPAAGESMWVSAVGAGASGTGLAWDAATVSVPQGSTIFGCLGLEGTGNGQEDTDTTNGSWAASYTTVANGGGATTSQCVSVQRKTVTATGNQSWGHTSANSRDWAANTIIVSYLETGSAAGTSTVTGVSLLTGSAAGTSTATSEPIVVGSAAGIADVSIRPGNIFVGTSGGTSTAAAVASIEGTAAGTSTATAVGTPLATATGSAAGTSTAVAEPIVAGSAAGTSTVSAVGAAAGEGAGSAAGTSTAFALLGDVIGTAAGTSTALGIADVGPVTEVLIAITEARDRISIQLAHGWPTDLPAPTLEGYSFGAAAAVDRREMDIGAARVYRRTKRAPIEVAVAWNLDEEQQVLLDGFQTLTLRQGAEWFGVELALPGGMALATARFKGKVDYRALGGPRWQTTATLELLDRAVMDDEELTDLLDDAGDDPAWPVDLLPHPILDGYVLTPKPSTIHTADDLPGLPYARQRSRIYITDLPASWELTADQAAIFDAFFRHRGKDGAQWFSFPLTQAVGTIDCDCRFTGEADWVPRAGGRWAVTAPLEIRERPVILGDGESLFGGLDFSIDGNSGYLPLI